MFLPWYWNYWELLKNIKQCEKYFCVKNSLWQWWEWEYIWTFLLWCLGVLQTSTEINSDSEKLSQLQKIIHQQQDNLSKQLSSYRNIPTEEEFLKSQISSLLKRQGQMAIRLCQELIIHTSGNWDHWSVRSSLLALITCATSLHEKLCSPMTSIDITLNL